MYLKNVCFWRIIKLYIIFLIQFCMYIDVRSLSQEEKIKLKRRLRMKEMSYDSDFKKLEREEGDLIDQLRRLKQDRSRIEVQIKENLEASKKISEKKDFITEELRHIKKRLIELG